jgi:MoaA/NifB/PqqE/SkfB family radical SAM enzyme
MVSTLYRRVYEAVNYRLRWVGGGRFSRFCRPTSIIFLLTERCNARCLHCDIWKNRGQEDSPTLEQWKGVVSELREWLGPVFIAFSGGEALLKPWAIDLVGHAVREGLYVEHLTHGYWKDQEMVERLAMTNPARITVSLDGLGETHSRVRGRENFFERTSTSIATLQRLQRERGLRYVIRLKTVVMSHNVAELGDLARFAAVDGTEIFYQPIEQNYNTEEDPRWFEHSDNWPTDIDAVTRAIRELLVLKRRGLPIANSEQQLHAMIAYFNTPDSLRVVTQSHSAHESQLMCNGLTMLQFQSNGDVTVCAGLSPMGNVTRTPVRRIWEERLAVLETGCCLQRRLTDAERARFGVAPAEGGGATTGSRSPS